MYSDRYARGPKLKLPQGPIILSAALVGASKKKKMMMMMMMKEVKFSSFDNRRFATLPMLSDNVIHQVSHKNH